MVDKWDIKELFDEKLCQASVDNCREYLKSVSIWWCALPVSWSRTVSTTDILEHD